MRAIPVYVDGEIFVGDCERLNLVECHMEMQREKCDDGNASRVNQREEKAMIGGDIVESAFSDGTEREIITNEVSLNASRTLLLTSFAPNHFVANESCNHRELQLSAD